MGDVRGQKKIYVLHTHFYSPSSCEHFSTHTWGKTKKYPPLYAKKNSIAFGKASRRETTDCWLEASLGAEGSGWHRGFQGAKAPGGGGGAGGHGLAATTWVPMGAQVPTLSPNDQPNPSQGQTEGFRKKVKI